MSLRDVSAADSAAISFSSSFNLREVIVKFERSSWTGDDFEFVDKEVEFKTSRREVEFINGVEFELIIDSKVFVAAVVPGCWPLKSFLQMSEVVNDPVKEKVPIVEVKIS